MEPRQLATWLRALADANRLRIVQLLMQRERCGCEIQVALGLTQSNVSRHLGYLKHAGLITDERRGQRVFYKLATSDPALAPLLEFLRTVLPARRRSSPSRIRGKRQSNLALARMAER